MNILRICLDGLVPQKAQLHIANKFTVNLDRTIQLVVLGSCGLASAYGCTS